MNEFKTQEGELSQNKHWNNPNIGRMDDSFWILGQRVPFHSTSVTWHY
jgi:hypothetical protein